MVWTRNNSSNGWGGGRRPLWRGYEARALYQPSHQQHSVLLLCSLSSHLVNALRTHLPLPLPLHVSFSFQVGAGRAVLNWTERSMERVATEWGSDGRRVMWQLLGDLNYPRQVIQHRYWGNIFIFPPKRLGLFNIQSNKDQASLVARWERIHLQCRRCRFDP